MQYSAYVAIRIKVPELANVNLSSPLQSIPSMHFRFSHKILMAACLVVVSVFLAFAVYNDYIQRKALQDSLQT